MAPLLPGSGRRISLMGRHERWPVTTGMGAPTMLALPDPMPLTRRNVHPQKSGAAHLSRKRWEHFLDCCILVTVYGTSMDQDYQRSGDVHVQDSLHLPTD